MSHPINDHLNLEIYQESSSIIPVILIEGNNQTILINTGSKRFLHDLQNRLKTKGIHKVNQLILMDNKSAFSGNLTELTKSTNSTEVMLLTKSGRLPKGFKEMDNLVYWNKTQLSKYNCKIQRINDQIHITLGQKNNRIEITFDYTENSHSELRIRHNNDIINHKFHYSYNPKRYNYKLKF